ncbi:ribonuclease Y [Pasteuria penetrans]|uniref:ribonuclease Y n=1 Tax=Pasteuria penetrans TaxID=86005 RepID=UPI000FAD3609|nr:ribonuclease Y [Pasteuria penetrans]
MESFVVYVIGGVFLLFLGLAVGYIGTRRLLEQARLDGARQEADRLVAVARQEAEAASKERLLEAKEVVHAMRMEAELEIREQRSELQRLERRLLQKEETLERKQDLCAEREVSLAGMEKELAVQKEKTESLYQEQLLEVERVTGMSAEEARKLLMQRAEEDMQREVTQMMRSAEQRALEESNKKARRIISLAIQRLAADHVAETTVSVVTLPNDEMKGRIIGREGRNIRTLETLTGVDLIIDDTPEAVILSGFDPIRREIARIALERLVADGRIHPARIEEIVEKSRRLVDEKIRDYGEQAVFEVGVHGLHPDLIKIIGRLRFRTSYGQNVLRHSLEVAHLTGLLAAELGEDVRLAKRSGLLHDIGKSIDHEVEGSHVDIGLELAKKYGEHPVVINSIASHHGDVDAASVIAVLVRAADTLSAARPGARRETLEAYIKRLEKLEGICESFSGVAKSYAIQAGRECRIIVKPEEVDDAESYRLAREISRHIKNQLDYPGSIKVTVVRETRAVEYAR